MRARAPTSTTSTWARCAAPVVRPLRYERNGAAGGQLRRLAAQVLWAVLHADDLGIAPHLRSCRSNDACAAHRSPRARSGSSATSWPAVIAESKTAAADRARARRGRLRPVWRRCRSGGGAGRGAPRRGPRWRSEERRVGDAALDPCRVVRTVVDSSVAPNSSPTDSRVVSQPTEARRITRLQQARGSGAAPAGDGRSHGCRCQCQPRVVASSIRYTACVARPGSAHPKPGMPRSARLTRPQAGIVASRGEARRTRPPLRSRSRIRP